MGYRFGNPLFFVLFQHKPYPEKIFEKRLTFAYDCDIIIKQSGKGQNNETFFPLIDSLAIYASVLE